MSSVFVRELLDDGEAALTSAGACLQARFELAL
jgi:hypothetical protein